MTGDEATETLLAIRALSAGLFALHDTLVARGALDPLEVATTLRRLVGEKEAYQAALEGVAGQFEAMPFAPATGPQLAVIEGGKEP